MHLERGNGAPSRPAADAPAQGPDALAALAERVDELESALRTLPVATDEKALKELRRTIDAFAKRDPKFEERVTNRVDVLADRLETLAKTLSSTSSAIAARDGEAVQLRRELDSKYAGVYSAIEELRRGFDPAAIGELKRALAARPQEKPARGLEGQVRDLAGKLSVLSQRIDTVSATVSTTAAGLAGRDGDVVSLRRAYEADTARIDAELADIRRAAADGAALGDLRQAVERARSDAADQKHASARLADELRTRLDTVTGRLDALDTSLDAVTGRVASTDNEIAAARSSLERVARQQSSLVGELTESLAALTSRVEELEEVESGAAQAFEDRISGVRQDVGELVVRLDSFESSLAAATERVDDRELELSAMERRFQGTSSRVDSLVEDLMQALKDFPDVDSLRDAQKEALGDLAGRLDRMEERISEQSQRAESGSAELDRRLTGERERVEELVARLESLATQADALERTGGELGSGLAEIAQRVETIERDASSDVVREVQQGHEELGRRLDGVAARLDAAEESREGTSAEVARIAAIVEVERASVRARLDALGATQEAAGASGSDELLQQLVVFAARVDALEAERSVTAAALDRMSAALDAERDSVQAQLDALAAALSVSPQSPADIDGRLDELARQLADVEARGVEVASELSRASTLWPEALRSLEARLDEIGRRAERAPSSGDGRPRLVSMSEEDDAAPHDEHADTPSATPFDDPGARVGLEVLPLRAADT